MDSNLISIRNKSDPDSQRESTTHLENLNIDTQVRQEFSQSTISNTQVQESEYYSVYRSTDFYIKDIDEKIEAPIELKNLELNNNLSCPISMC